MSSDDRTGISGAIEDAKGKAKEAAGALTDKDDLQDEGQAQQKKVEAEEKAQQKKQEAEEAAAKEKAAN